MTISGKIQYFSTYIFLLATLVLAPQVIAAQAACTELVWSDEFETAGAPKAANWNFETGGGGWGNNELQFYTSSSNNSYVSNGTLKIHAKKLNGTWTSARMVTSGKASWKYGRFEIKAKLPAGRGTWPAIWMMPQTSTYGGWPKSGEIDIMEHVGYEMNKVHGTVHTEAYNHSIGTQKGGSTTLSEVDKNFYVYAIEWNEQEIKWFVDGQQYFVFKNENKTYKEWPFDHPFFLILNIAIGGNWGGAQGIDPNLTEAIMEIDYVRIYSTSISKPVLSGPAFVTPGEQVTFTTPKIGQLQYRWSLPAGVTIVSGNNTNAITVQWNDQPGEVSVEAFNECQSVSSNVIQVGLKATPIGKYWPVPLIDGQNNLLWTAVPGAENQITLRRENDELVVTYNIQNTSVNPHIKLVLPVITDLSAHKQAEVQLKTTADMSPYNLRIDFIDVNGQIDLTDLFKIDGPISDGQYHTYQKLFAMSTLNGWQPSKIANILLYFNYGILGKKGPGEFRLKGAQMINNDFVSSIIQREQVDFQLYPNPAGDQVEIRASYPFSRVQLTDISGQVIHMHKAETVYQLLLPLNNVAPGIYIVTVYPEKGPPQVAKMVKK